MLYHFLPFCSECSFSLKRNWASQFQMITLLDYKISVIHHLVGLVCERFDFLRHLLRLCQLPRSECTTSYCQSYCSFFTLILLLGLNDYLLDSLERLTALVIIRVIINLPFSVQPDKISKNSCVLAWKHGTLLQCLVFCTLNLFSFLILDTDLNNSCVELCSNPRFYTDIKLLSSSLDSDDGSCCNFHLQDCKQSESNIFCRRTAVILRHCTFNPPLLLHGQILLVCSWNLVISTEPFSITRYVSFLHFV